MFALAHLGANDNTRKQKPTLSRHQNAIAVTAQGEPYPATGSAVSLLIWALKIICTDSLTQSRTSKAPGECLAERRQKPQVDIGVFISEGSHLVKFGRCPLLLLIPLER